MATHDGHDVKVSAQPAVLRSKQGPIGRPAGLGAPISGQLAEGRPETAGRGRSPTLS